MGISIIKVDKKKQFEESLIMRPEIKQTKQTKVNYPILDSDNLNFSELNIDYSVSKKNQQNILRQFMRFQGSRKSQSVDLNFVKMKPKNQDKSD